MPGCVYTYVCSGVVSETGSLPEPGGHHLVWARLTSSKGLPVSASQSLSAGITGACSHTLLIAVGSERSNSGPQVCVVVTLLTEPAIAISL